MKTEPIPPTTAGKWQPGQTVANAFSSLTHPVPRANEFAHQAESKTKKTRDGEFNASIGPHLRIPNVYSGSDAFEKLLSDAMDESMTELLGTRPREAVYDFMERRYSVGRDEISQHLNELFELFEKIFGPPSRKTIGRAFAKKVYSKLDWEFTPIPDYEFADYLKAIKTRITRELLHRTKPPGRPEI